MNTPKRPFRPRVFSVLLALGAGASTRDTVKGSVLGKKLVLQENGACHRLVGDDGHLLGV